MTSVDIPLPHPAFDWAAHQRDLSALLGRLEAAGLLYELSDGHARHLHDVTTPAERRTIYLEALLQYDPLHLDTVGLVIRAERLLPPGIRLHGPTARHQRWGRRDPYVSAVSGARTALLQLERRGMAYEHRTSRMEWAWCLVGGMTVDGKVGGAEIAMGPDRAQRSS